MAASGTMAERLDGSGGSVQWTNYLVAGGELVGMRVENGSTVYTRYFSRDHLGSIAVITDTSGAVLERLSYDAWGKRRFPDGSDDTTGSITSQTSRGFTGHEELADVALVHMNGRVYDPLLGRFGTADPTTENPLSTQGWNRYSYVGNSPLNFSDPSGYCFLGCFWQPIFNFIAKNITSILTTIATYIAPAICGPLAAVCAIAAAAIISATVAGIQSGSLGVALRAGLTAGLQAAAFVELGNIVGPNPAFASTQYFENVAGSAAIGCLTSVASGGKCGPGALSLGVSAGAAPLISMAPGGQLVDRSLVGGLASVAGGGKFANGAATAAFRYLLTVSLEDARQARSASERPTQNNLTDLEEYSDVMAFDKGGGGMHACDQGFSTCRTYSEQLYDKGYEAESNQLYLSCRATLQACYINEEAVQTDPNVKGGETYFPPNKAENGGGFVTHWKGASPFYTPPSTDPITPIPPKP